MPDHTFHVDLIDRQPLAGSLRLLGRVYVDDHDQVRVAAGIGDERQIVEYVESIRARSGAGGPVAFLESLGESIDSTFVFASETHSWEDCPFEGDQMVIPDIPDGAAQPHAVAG